MPTFIKGRDLCRDFFFEIAKPILDSHFPQLKYSAGLLGYGSDILGYDDAVSTDHMWGPRFYLFLERNDIALKEDIRHVSHTGPCEKLARRLVGGVKIGKCDEHHENNGQHRK